MLVKEFLDYVQNAHVKELYVLSQKVPEVFCHFHISLCHCNLLIIKNLTSL